MSVVVILILASLALGLLFLVGFVWAVRAGQYDDTSTPSMRVLPEDVTPHPDPLPSEGRGGATSATDLRTALPAFVHSKLPLHTQSESNHP